MTVKKLKRFILENHYQQMWFAKENNYVKKP